ncbi:MAG: dihydrolipoamide acetyltransferase family protein [Gammaproteobacteria bacterium]
MRRELLMPKLGLTMTEGLLCDWLVPEGGAFRAGSPLFIVETEKVATEIEAEQDGVLLQVAVPVGETVPVGAVVGYWEDGKGAHASAPAPAPAAAIDAPSGARSDAQTDAQSDSQSRARPRLLATPLARRIAASLGVDLAGLRGSGPRGRIKADDVRAAHAAAPPARGAEGGALPEASAAALAAGTSVAPQASGMTRIAPTAVQLATARRLSAVKATVPHFYLSTEADVGRLLALREELNALGTVRLTINHFIVAALGRALRDEPDANRVWIDDAILQFEGSDVGVAVDTDRGLFVPVVRDAGRLPLAELARASQHLVERARQGRLSAADTAGGAVTVSNAGMHDLTYMTPIINPGQSMILGVGSVREVFRPDAAGQPALRREMGLVLACDHRILAGVSGLRFLNRVVGHLEQPLGLVLGA